jgi:hypothetical protein
MDGATKFDIAGGILSGGLAVEQSHVDVVLQPGEAAPSRRTVTRMRVPALARLEISQVPPISSTRLRMFLKPFRPVSGAA